LDAFFDSLSLEKKIAILCELKVSFENRHHLLLKALQDRPDLASHILKIQEDYFKEYPKQYQKL
jgi:hypothetical protein